MSYFTGIYGVFHITADRRKWNTSCQVEEKRIVSAPGFLARSLNQMSHMNTTRRIPPLAAMLSLAAGLTLLPGAAEAQVHFSIYGRGGLYAPDEYFYEEFQKFADEEPTKWSTGSLGRSGMFGVGTELWWGDGDIRVRGELMRTVDAWLRVSHSILYPRILWEPPRIVTEWLDVPYAATLATVQVVLPTRLTIWKVEPFFLVGGGAKYYHFDDPTYPPQDDEVIFPEDGFAYLAEVGFGITIPVWKGLGVEAQVRDTTNKYWQKRQHDFLFSGYVSWTFR
jgi:hypothetical protein